MTRTPFKLKEIKDYQKCPSCDRFKTWRQFKRPQKGGILPMVVHSECNLCARVRAWFNSLSEELKQKLELEEEEEASDELGICEICGAERYGKRRDVYNDKWICNFCFWSHILGRKMIDKEKL